MSSPQVCSGLLDILEHFWVNGSETATNIPFFSNTTLEPPKTTSCHQKPAGGKSHFSKPTSRRNPKKRSHTYKTDVCLFCICVKTGNILIFWCVNTCHTSEGSPRSNQAQGWPGLLQYILQPRRMIIPIWHVQLPNAHTLFSFEPRSKGHAWRSKHRTL